MLKQNLRPPDDFFFIENEIARQSYKPRRLFRGRLSLVGSFLSFKSFVTIAVDMFFSSSFLSFLCSKFPQPRQRALVLRIGVSPPFPPLTLPALRHTHSLPVPRIAQLANFRGGIVEASHSYFLFLWRRRSSHI